MTTIKTETPRHLSLIQTIQWSSSCVQKQKTWFTHWDMQTPLQPSVFIFPRSPIITALQLKQAHTLWSFVTGNSESGLKLAIPLSLYRTQNCSNLSNHCVISPPSQSRGDMTSNQGGWCWNTRMKTQNKHHFKISTMEGSSEKMDWSGTTQWQFEQVVFWECVAHWWQIWFGIS